MDSKRARDIVVAKETANVTYEGRNVYIENVNPVKETASIHFLDHPQNSQEVHLTQLVENE